MCKRVRTRQRAEIEVTPSNSKATLGMCGYSCHRKVSYTCSLLVIYIYIKYIFSIHI